MERIKYFFAIVLVSIVSVTAVAGAASTLEGLYYGSLGEEDLTLQLIEGNVGQVSGSFSLGEVRFQIDGTSEAQFISGTLSGNGAMHSFEGWLQGDQLALTVITQDVGFGATQETILFQRADAASSSPPAAAAPTSGEVWVNGSQLNEAQLRELAKAYGVTPQPGRYWYDGKSGLYGAEGYQAFGFMLPGHTLGSMTRDCSGGVSDVLVNGREVPLTECALWSQLLGYAVLPGNYWLDEAGNTGYEGVPVPVDNLYLAAQRTAYGGGSGGGGGDGDNFWTSRFSGGNSDQGGSRGYVSVPGHGPVGYGF